MIRRASSNRSKLIGKNCLLFWLASLSLNAHAGSFDLSYLFKASLFGGSYNETEKFHAFLTDSSNLNLFYKVGEERGWLIGGTLASDHFTGKQTQTSNRAADTFRGTYVAYGLMGGAFAQIGSSSQIEGSIAIRKGNVTYKGDGNAETLTLSNVTSADAMMLVRWTLFEPANGPKTIFSTGAGFHTIFMPNFDYGGVSYGKEDLGTLGFLMLNIGLGINF